ncbi:alpha/beta fold hydrolase [Nocardia jinanensis]|uniref:Acetoin dehydrogenase n=1 Tax=Nocardia jinanensis TaxID=382504 RepID=A0A917RZN3_9NOCA|nr:alpha/beta fold hydrolase [Nocardia jinanensis]GGL47230.1 acetoin dehydrogenase [Nocardia jinanensis]
MRPESTPPEGLRATGTQEIAVRGRRTRYLDEGTGTPTLLIHGIGRSLEDWIEQHRLLAGRGLRVISVDLAGYGESEPLSELYSLSALATFLADFLDTVGITEPAHVVGNSLGGAVAMQLSAQAPGRVRSLVLAAPAGFGREVALSIRMLSIPPLGRLIMRTWSPRASRRLERSLFHDTAMATEERIQLGYRLARRPDGTRVLLETVTALGGPRGTYAGWRAALLEVVADRAVPTLIVWGDKDRLFPAAHLDAARTRLPHVRTHLLRNTGHVPQIERADEFAALATEFWTDLPPA